MLNEVYSAMPEKDLSLPELSGQQWGVLVFGIMMSLYLSNIPLFASFINKILFSQCHVPQEYEEAKESQIRVRVR